MLSNLLERNDVHLEKVENLQWNQCGYTRSEGEITRIGFYGIPLKSIDEELFEFENLEMLSLIHNELKEIPPKIGKLSKLKELYLGGNELTTLPDDVGQLKELKYLYIIEDSFKRIPQTLADIHHLEELVIRTNYEEDVLMQIKTYGIQSKKIVVNDVEIFL